MTTTPKVMGITIERDLDVVSKRWEERVYLRLYVALRTSGLLAAMRDKDFRTLVAIATFMNKDGRCYPSQRALAGALGISQGSVAKRIKSLLAFRWEGKPLVRVEKVRSQRGQFENTVYTVLPETSLAIFSRTGDDAHIPAVHMDTGNLNEKSNGNNSVTETVERTPWPRSRGGRQDDPMAEELAAAMGDRENLAYYRRIVASVPPAIFLRARGEVLEERRIKKSRGAMFAYLIKKYASPQRPAST